MKIGQIAISYPALLRLSQTAAMDFKVSYKLHRLLSELKHDVDFYTKSELEILKKYGKERESEPGTYDIVSILDRLKANDEFKALRDTESQIIFEKVKIFPENLKITAHDIGSLEPFIDFIFEDKEKNQC